MFYLLLIIYLIPVCFLLYWVVRLAFFLIKNTVKLAWWLVCKVLVLLGRAMRWAFVSLWHLIRSRRTVTESSGI